MARVWRLLRGPLQQQQAESLLQAGGLLQRNLSHALGGLLAGPARDRDSLAALRRLHRSVAQRRLRAVTLLPEAYRRSHLSPVLAQACRIDSCSAVSSLVQEQSLQHIHTLIQSSETVLQQNFWRHQQSDKLFIKKIQTQLREQSITMTSALFIGLLENLPFGCSTPDTMELLQYVTEILEVQNDLFDSVLQNINMKPRDNVYRFMQRALKVLVMSPSDLATHQKSLVGRLIPYLTDKPCFEMGQTVVKISYKEILQVIREDDFPEDITNARDTIITAIQSKRLDAYLRDFDATYYNSDRWGLALAFLQRLAIRVPNAHPISAYVHALYIHVRLRSVDISTGGYYQPATHGDIAMLLNAFGTLGADTAEVSQEIYQFFRKEIPWQIILSDFPYHKYGQPRHLLVAMLSKILQHQYLKLCHKIIIQNFLGKVTDPMYEPLYRKYKDNAIFSPNDDWFAFLHLRKNRTEISVLPLPIIILVDEINVEIEDGPDIETDTEEATESTIIPITGATSGIHEIVSKGETGEATAFTVETTTPKGLKHVDEDTKTPEVSTTCADEDCEDTTPHPKRTEFEETTSHLGLKITGKEASDHPIITPPTPKEVSTTCAEEDCEDTTPHPKQTEFEETTSHLGLKITGKEASDHPIITPPTPKEVSTTCAEEDCEDTPPHPKQTEFEETTSHLGLKITGIEGSVHPITTPAYATTTTPSNKILGRTKYNASAGLDICCLEEYKIQTLNLPSLFHALEADTPFSVYAAVYDVVSHFQIQVIGLPGDVNRGELLEYMLNFLKVEHEASDELTVAINNLLFYISDSGQGSLYPEYNLVCKDEGRLFIMPWQVVKSTLEEATSTTTEHISTSCTEEECQTSTAEISVATTEQAIKSTEVGQKTTTEDISTSCTEEECQTSTAEVSVATTEQSIKSTEVGQETTAKEISTSCTEEECQTSTAEVSVATTEQAIKSTEVGQEITAEEISTSCTEEECQTSKAEVSVATTEQAIKSTEVGQKTTAEEISTSCTEEECQTSTADVSVATTEQAIKSTEVGQETTAEEISTSCTEEECQTSTAEVSVATTEQAIKSTEIGQKSTAEEISTSCTEEECQTSTAEVSVATTEQAIRSTEVGQETTAEEISISCTEEECQTSTAEVSVATTEQAIKSTEVGQETTAEEISTSCTEEECQTSTAEVSVATTEQAIRSTEVGQETTAEEISTSCTEEECQTSTAEVSVATTEQAIKSTEIGAETTAEEISTSCTEEECQTSTAEVSVATTEQVIKSTEVGQETTVEEISTSCTEEECQTSTTEISVATAEQSIKSTEVGQETTAEEISTSCTEEECQTSTAEVSVAMTEQATKSTEVGQETTAEEISTSCTEEECQTSTAEVSVATTEQDRKSTKVGQVTTAEEMSTTCTEEECQTSTAEVSVATTEKAIKSTEVGQETTAEEISTSCTEEECQTSTAEVSVATTEQDRKSTKVGQVTTVEEMSTTCTEEECQTSTAEVSVAMTEQAIKSTEVGQETTAEEMSTACTEEECETFTTEISTATTQPAIKTTEQTDTTTILHMVTICTDEEACESATKQQNLTTKASEKPTTTSVDEVTSTCSSEDGILTCEENTVTESTASTIEVTTVKHTTSAIEICAKSNDTLIWIDIDSLLKAVSSKVSLPMLKLVREHIKPEIALTFNVECHKSRGKLLQQLLFHMKFNIPLPPLVIEAIDHVILNIRNDGPGALLPTVLCVNKYNTSQVIPLEVPAIGLRKSDNTTAVMTVPTLTKCVLNNEEGFEVMVIPLGPITKAIGPDAKEADIEQLISFLSGSEVHKKFQGFDFKKYNTQGEMLSKLFDFLLNESDIESETIDAIEAVFPHITHDGTGALQLDISYVCKTNGSECCTGETVTPHGVIPSTETPDQCQECSDDALVVLLNLGKLFQSFNSDTPKAAKETVYQFLSSSGNLTQLRGDGFCDILTTREQATTVYTSPLPTTTTTSTTTSTTPSTTTTSTKPSTTITSTTPSTTTTTSTTTTPTTTKTTTTPTSTTTKTTTTTTTTERTTTPEVTMTPGTTTTDGPWLIKPNMSPCKDEVGSQIIKVKVDPLLDILDDETPAESKAIVRNFFLKHDVYKKLQGFNVEDFKTRGELLKEMLEFLVSETVLDEELVDALDELAKHVTMDGVGALPPVITVVCNTTKSYLTTFINSVGKLRRKRLVGDQALDTKGTFVHYSIDEREDMAGDIENPGELVQAVLQSGLDRAQVCRNMDERESTIQSSIWLIPSARKLQFKQLVYKILTGFEMKGHSKQGELLQDILKYIACQMDIDVKISDAIKEIYPYIDVDSEGTLPPDIELVCSKSIPYLAKVYDQVSTAAENCDDSTCSTEVTTVTPGYGCHSGLAFDVGKQVYQIDVASLFEAVKSTRVQPEIDILIKYLNTAEAYKEILGFKLNTYKTRGNLLKHLLSELRFHTTLDLDIIHAIYAVLPHIQMIGPGKLPNVIRLICSEGRRIHKVEEGTVTSDETSTDMIDYTTTPNPLLRVDENTDNNSLTLVTHNATFQPVYIPLPCMVGNTEPQLLPNFTSLLTAVDTSRISEQIIMKAKQILLSPKVVLNFKDFGMVQYRSRVQLLRAIIIHLKAAAILDDEEEKVLDQVYARAIAYESGARAPDFLFVCADNGVIVKRGEGDCENGEAANTYLLDVQSLFQAVRSYAPQEQVNTTLQWFADFNVYKILCEFRPENYHTKGEMMQELLGYITGSEGVPEKVVLAFSSLLEYIQLDGPGDDSSGLLRVCNVTVSEEQPCNTTTEICGPATSEEDTTAIAATTVSIRTTRQAKSSTESCDDETNCAESTTETTITTEEATESEQATTTEVCDETTCAETITETKTQLTSTATVHPFTTQVTTEQATTPEVCDDTTCTESTTEEATTIKTANNNITTSHANVSETTEVTATEVCDGTTCAETTDVATTIKIVNNDNITTSHTEVSETTETITAITSMNSVGTLTDEANVETTEATTKVCDETTCAQTTTENVPTVYSKNSGNQSVAEITTVATESEQPTTTEVCDDTTCTETTTERVITTKLVHDSNITSPHVLDSETTEQCDETTCDETTIEITKVSSEETTVSRETAEVPTVSSAETIEPSTLGRETAEASTVTSAETAEASTLGKETVEESTVSSAETYEASTVISTETVQTSTVTSAETVEASTLRRETAEASTVSGAETVEASTLRKETAEASTVTCAETAVASTLGRETVEASTVTSAETAEASTVTSAETAEASTVTSTETAEASTLGRETVEESTVCSAETYEASTVSSTETVQASTATSAETVEASTLRRETAEASTVSGAETPQASTVSSAKTPQALTVSGAETVEASTLRRETAEASTVTSAETAEALTLGKETVEASTLRREIAEASTLTSAETAKASTLGRETDEVSTQSGAETPEASTVTSAETAEASTQGRETPEASTASSTEIVQASTVTSAETTKASKGNSAETTEESTVSSGEATAKECEETTHETDCEETEEPTDSTVTEDECDENSEETPCDEANTEKNIILTTEETASSSPSPERTEETTECGETTEEISTEETTCTDSTDETSTESSEEECMESTCPEEVTNTVSTLKNVDDGVISTQLVTQHAEASSPAPQLNLTYLGWDGELILPYPCIALGTVEVFTVDINTLLKAFDSKIESAIVSSISLILRKSEIKRLLDNFDWDKHKTRGRSLYNALSFISNSTQINAQETEAIKIALKHIKYTEEGNLSPVFKFECVIDKESPPEFPHETNTSIHIMTEKCDNDSTPIVIMSHVFTALDDQAPSDAKNIVKEFFDCFEFHKKIRGFNYSEYKTRGEFLREVLYFLITDVNLEHEVLTAVTSLSEHVRTNGAALLPPNITIVCNITRPPREEVVTETTTSSTDQERIGRRTTEINIMTTTEMIPTEESPTITTAKVEENNPYIPWRLVDLNISLAIPRQCSLKSQSTLVTSVDVPSLLQAVDDTVSEGSVMAVRDLLRSQEMQFELKDYDWEKNETRAELLQNIIFFIMTSSEKYTEAMSSSMNDVLSHIRTDGPGALSPIFKYICLNYDESGITKKVTSHPDDACVDDSGNLVSQVPLLNINSLFEVLLPEVSNTSKQIVANVIAQVGFYKKLQGFDVEEYNTKGELLKELLTFMIGELKLSYSEVQAAKELLEGICEEGPALEAPNFSTVCSVEVQIAVHLVKWENSSLQISTTELVAITISTTTTTTPSLPAQIEYIITPTTGKCDDDNSSQATPIVKVEISSLIQAFGPHTPPQAKKILAEFFAQSDFYQYVVGFNLRNYLTRGTLLKDMLWHLTAEKRTPAVPEDVLQAIYETREYVLLQNAGALAPNMSYICNTTETAIKEKPKPPPFWMALNPCVETASGSVLKLDFQFILTALDVNVSQAPLYQFMEYTMEEDLRRELHGIHAQEIYTRGEMLSEILTFLSNKNDVAQKVKDAIHTLQGYVIHDGPGALSIMQNTNCAAEPKYAFDVVGKGPVLVDQSGHICINNKTPDKQTIYMLHVGSLLSVIRNESPRYSVVKVITFLVQPDVGKYLKGFDMTEYPTRGQLFKELLLFISSKTSIERSVRKAAGKLIPFTRLGGPGKLPAALITTCTGNTTKGEDDDYTTTLAPEVTTQRDVCESHPEGVAAAVVDLEALIQVFEPEALMRYKSIIYGFLSQTSSYNRLSDIELNNYITKGELMQDLLVELWIKPEFGGELKEAAKKLLPFVQYDGPGGYPPSRKLVCMNANTSEIYEGEWGKITVNFTSEFIFGSDKQCSYLGLNIHATKFYRFDLESLFFALQRDTSKKYTQVIKDYLQTSESNNALQGLDLDKAFTRGELLQTILTLIKFSSHHGSPELKDALKHLMSRVQQKGPLSRQPVNVSIACKPSGNGSAQIFNLLIALLTEEELTIEIKQALNIIWEAIIKAEIDIYGLLPEIDLNNPYSRHELLRIIMYKLREVRTLHVQNEIYLVILWLHEREIEIQREKEALENNRLELEQKHRETKLNQSIIAYEVDYPDLLRIIKITAPSAELELLMNFTRQPEFKQLMLQFNARDYIRQGELLAAAFTYLLRQVDLPDDIRLAIQRLTPFIDFDDLGALPPTIHKVYVKTRTEVNIISLDFGTLFKAIPRKRLTREGKIALDMIFKYLSSPSVNIKELLKGINSQQSPRIQLKIILLKLKQIVGEVLGTHIDVILNYLHEEMVNESTAAVPLPNMDWIEVLHAVPETKVPPEVLWAKKDLYVFFVSKTFRSVVRHYLADLNETRAKFLKDLLIFLRMKPELKMVKQPISYVLPFIKEKGYGLAIVADDVIESGDEEEAKIGQNRVKEIIYQVLSLIKLEGSLEILQSLQKIFINTKVQLGSTFIGFDVLDDFPQKEKIIIILNRIKHNLGLFLEDDTMSAINVVLSQLGEKPSHEEMVSVHLPIDLGTLIQEVLGISAPARVYDAINRIVSLINLKSLRLGRAFEGILPSFMRLEAKAKLTVVLRILWRIYSKQHTQHSSEIVQSLRVIYEYVQPNKRGIEISSEEHHMTIIATLISVIRVDASKQVLDAKRVIVDHLTSHQHVFDKALAELVAMNLPPKEFVARALRRYREHQPEMAPHLWRAITIIFQYLGIEEHDSSEDQTDDSFNVVDEFKDLIEEAGHGVGRSKQIILKFMVEHKHEITRVFRGHRTLFRYPPREKMALILGRLLRLYRKKLDQEVITAIGDILRRLEITGESSEEVQGDEIDVSKLFDEVIDKSVGTEVQAAKKIIEETLKKNPNMTEKVLSGIVIQEHFNPQRRMATILRRLQRKFRLNLSAQEIRALKTIYDFLEISEDSSVEDQFVGKLRFEQLFSKVFPSDTEPEILEASNRVVELLKCDDTDITALLRGLHLWKLPEDTQVGLILYRMTKFMNLTEQDNSTVFTLIDNLDYDLSELASDDRDESYKPETLFDDALAMKEIPAEVEEAKGILLHHLTSGRSVLRNVYRGIDFSNYSTASGRLMALLRNVYYKRDQLGNKVTEALRIMSAYLHEPLADGEIDPYTFDFGGTFDRAVPSFAPVVAHQAKQALVQAINKRPGTFKKVLEAVRVQENETEHETARKILNGIVNSRRQLAARIRTAADILWRFLRGDRLEDDPSLQSALEEEDEDQEVPADDMLAERMFMDETPKKKPSKARRRGSRRRGD